MLVVHENPTAQRFEMTAGDAVAFVTYERTSDRVVLIHTEVPKALSGQGVGSRLVGGVLDIIRGEGKSVVPQCEFVAAFIARHPGYQSLVAKE